VLLSPSFGGPEKITSISFHEILDLRSCRGAALDRHLPRRVQEVLGSTAPLGVPRPIGGWGGFRLGRDPIDLGHIVQFLAQHKR